LLPQDKDARDKYQHTIKEYKEREFAKCIATEEKKILVNLDDIVVEDSYTGPKLNSIDDINTEWVLSLMSYQQGQKNLHRKYATMLVLRCIDIFEKDVSLV
jgi:serine/threonine-protein phosphatase 5